MQVKSTYYASTEDMHCEQRRHDLKLEETYYEIREDVLYEQRRNYASRENILCEQIRCNQRKHLMQADDT